MQDRVDSGHPDLVTKLLTVLAEENLEFSRDSLVALVAYMQAQNSFNVATMKVIIKSISGEFNNDDIETLFHRESQVTEGMNDFIDSFLLKKDAAK